MKTQDSHQTRDSQNLQGILQIPLGWGWGVKSLPLL